MEQISLSSQRQAYLFHKGHIQPMYKTQSHALSMDFLGQNKELNLHIRRDGSTKYSPEPDFKFVVIEKFLSIENEFAIRDGLLLNSYFFLKNLGQSDERAFGLEKSDVVIEQVPLVYHPIEKLQLKRSSHQAL